MANASPNTSLPKDSGNLPPPSTTIKKAKGKKDKASNSQDEQKLVLSTLARLEQNVAGEKTEKAELDREVKKESRHVDEELTKINDPIERAEAVKKRYESLYAEMEKLRREFAKSKKRSDQLQKEKDKMTSDFNKANTQKDKMEKLSRTFQQENKKLKDDNKRLEETEKTARETVNTRLDSLLMDVQDVMESKVPSHSENLNMELDEIIKTRCKVLFDQAELRELHFKSILRHKDAEIAHLGAKHEVERKRADSEASRCRTLTSQVSTFSHTEAELRSQLNIYVEKFKQVEDTLNNSNELFLTFRKEMEEMSKKTKTLEKDNARLTKKHEALKGNIIKMAEERDRCMKEMDVLKAADSKMRGIIKSMQEQGRGGPVQELIDENSDSEYDDYDEEEDESYVEGEDDIQDQETLPDKRSLGPVPPPPGEVKQNGARPVGIVNGVKH